jgi:Adenylate kinase and related kinases
VIKGEKLSYEILILGHLCWFSLFYFSMAPLAYPLPKESHESTGVNAILLGPPGSGKGTQVSKGRESD